MADIESRLVPKDDESSAEILREDQAKINKFARLNNRKDELKAELEKLNKDKQDLEDAGDELLMQDDERVKFSLGDCFVYLSPDEVEERLGKMTGENEDAVTSTTQQLDGIQKEMNELKVQLYAKFGKSINLETD